MNMKSFYLSLLVPCVFVSMVFSDDTEKRHKVRITGDNLNMRAVPSATSEVVGQLDAGEVVLAKKLEDEWVEIVPPFKVDLWVHGDFINANVVSCPKVNVRAGPGITFSIVGQLLEGDKVVPRGHSGEWMNIAPPEKCSVWVASSFVELVPEEKPPPVTNPAPPVATGTVAAAKDTVKQPETETKGETVVDSDITTNSTPTNATTGVVETAKTEAPEEIENTGKVITNEVPEEIEAPLETVEVTDDWKETEVKKREIPPPSDLDLVPAQEQGVLKTFSGILRPAGFLFGRPSPFRIVSHDEEGNGQTVCYVKGNKAQLRALLGRKMSVTGRVYWVQNQKYPVLVPERIVMEY